MLPFRIPIHTQHSQRSRTFDLHSFESRHAAAELGETPQTQRGHPGLRGYLRTAAWWRSDIWHIFYLTFDISVLWIYVNVHSSHKCNNEKQPRFFSFLVKTLSLWCPCRRSSLLPGEWQRCNFLDCVWPERKHAVQIQSSGPDHAGLWTGARGNHHHWIPRWRYAVERECYSFRPFYNMHLTVNCLMFQQYKILPYISYTLY